MNEGQQPNSHLFTIRVWQEQIDEQIQWRGKLRHVPSGEIRYFRGWAALIPLMLDILRRCSGQNLVDNNEESSEGK